MPNLVVGISWLEIFSVNLELSLPSNIFWSWAVVQHLHHSLTTSFFLFSSSVFTSPRLKNFLSRTPQWILWTAKSCSSGTPGCDAKSAIPVQPYLLGGLAQDCWDEMGHLGGAQPGGLAVEGGAGQDQGHSAEVEKIFSFLSTALMKLKFSAITRKFWAKLMNILCSLSPNCSTVKSF